MKPVVNELLKNLTIEKDYLKSTVEEGVAALGPCAKELEAVHIQADYLAPSTWRKKKYYHIERHEACSRLDEWIFENLVDQNQYAGYLDRHRPALRQGKIADIDEYILDRYYRPRALRVLARKKGFGRQEWSRKRVCVGYRRRSNLFLKDGEKFGWGTSAQELFIRGRGEDREILGIGGGAGSGYREAGTFFTAVFYLLGKKIRIPHYLLRYNRFNEFEYAGCRYRTVIPHCFGSNYALDRRLEEEICRKGISVERVFEAAKRLDKNKERVCR